MAQHVHRASKNCPVIFWPYLRIDSSWLPLIRGFKLCDRCGQAFHGNAQEVLIPVPPRGLMRGDVGKACYAVGMFLVGVRYVGDFLL